MFRSKWKIFFGLIGINLAFILGGVVSWIIGAYQLTYKLILPAIFQVTWLYSLGDKLHWGMFDKTKSCEVLCTPNALGWSLLVIGLLTTLILYYLISSFISKRYYHTF